LKESLTSCYRRELNGRNKIYKYSTKKRKAIKEKYKLQNKAIENKSLMYTVNILDHHMHVY